MIIFFKILSFGLKITCIFDNLNARFNANAISSFTSVLSPTGFDTETFEHSIISYLKKAILKDYGCHVTGRRMSMLKRAFFG